jgi:vanillate O-demethylase monooxygenase subunit
MYPFADGSFAVRNAWYVAAFAQEVTRALLARMILNQPVVLYRKENGEAVAVGGRCPHRHFPLGKSCLKGDTIVCGYHGLAFGPDGQCVDIPSQSTVPKRIRIPTYPLVEYGLWLFIWMGDPNKADPSLLPDLAELGLTNPRLASRPFFINHVAARYQLLNDNLLDLSHVAFLHDHSVGDTVEVDAPEQLTRRPGVFTSTRMFRDTSGPQERMAALGMADDRVDRITSISFYLPGFHLGIEGVLFPRDHPTHAGKAISLNRVYHTITPATHRTCHYLFAMTGPPAILDEAKAFLRPVIDEDIVAVEEIEKLLALVGESPGELYVKSDRNAVEARRTLQAMMDAET